MGSSHNIINFLNNNPTVDCVEWKDLKIFISNGTLNAEHYYTLYGDKWEDDEDMIVRDSISETSYINEFTEQVLEWVSKHEN